MIQINRVLLALASLDRKASDNSNKFLPRTGKLLKILQVKDGVISIDKDSTEKTSKTDNAIPVRGQHNLTGNQLNMIKHHFVLHGQASLSLKRMLIIVSVTNTTKSAGTVSD